MDIHICILVNDIKQDYMYNYELSIYKKRVNITKQIHRRFQLTNPTRVLLFGEHHLTNKYELYRNQTSYQSSKFFFSF